jgi:hypothetical protein
MVWENSIPHNLPFAWSKPVGERELDELEGGAE